MTDALTVLQFTDMHLHAARDSRMRGVRTYDTFLLTIESAMSRPDWNADAIIVTGDIVQDESRAGYEIFRDMLSIYGLPVLCTPGNHDDPKLMTEILTSRPFQLDGSMRFDDWSVVLMSTHLLGEDAGGLGARRLERLDQTLKEHADQHVLLCMHHHPLPMGSRWLDGVALRDSTDLLQLIDRHRNVRALTCGHVHQASVRERNNVTYFTSPSTCAQFLPSSEYFALDKAPPGCRWFRLHSDGFVESEVHWVETAIE